MLFGEEQQKAEPEAGRWSTPSMVSLTEKLQDHLMVARASIGSGSVEGYKAQAKETAGVLIEKGSYVASGAYSKASQAKHAALDWITAMTASSNT